MSDDYLAFLKTHLSEREQNLKQLYEMRQQGVSLPKIREILSKHNIPIDNKYLYYAPGINVPLNHPFITQDLDEQTANIAENGIAFWQHTRYWHYYLHRHNFFEIIYVYSGTCQNIIEGKNYVMQKGALCIIPPYVRHAIAAYQDEALVFNTLLTTALVSDFYLKLLPAKTKLYQFLKDSLFSSSRTSFFLCHTGRDAARGDSVIDSLYEISLRLLESPDIHPLLKSITLVLLRHLSEGCDAAAECRSITYHTSSKIQNILYAMQKAPQNMTLTALALQFSYSPTYLSALLKRETGLTFTALLKNIRITQACYYLLDPAISLNDICAAVGYHSVSHFKQIFQESTGMTPAHFRAEFRQLSARKETRLP